MNDIQDRVPLFFSSQTRYISGYRHFGGAAVRQPPHPEA